jgi:hypothetical protein
VPPPVRFPGYEQVTRLRSLGALEYLTARDARTGEDRVLVAITPGETREEAATLLLAIARTHALVDHPWVPRVVEAAPDFVALAASAAADAELLAETAVRTGIRLSQAGAPAFAIAFLEMLDRSHQAIDPATGRPLCLGVVAAPNVLVGEDGRVSVLGWGHPHHPAARARLFPGIQASFAAPEVAFGAEPRPGSDLQAATLFFYSVLHMGTLQPEVVAAQRGEVFPGKEELLPLTVELLTISHAPTAEGRSIPRFLEIFRQILEVIGVVPDLEGIQRELARLAQEGRARARLVVGEEGRWFQVVGSERVRLERRGTLRRVLAVLAEAHRQQPDRAVSWDRLFAAAWPGETVHPESARNRVYVAIAELRSLGLRDLLARRDDGYLIAPSTWLDIGVE